MVGKICSCGLRTEKISSLGSRVSEKVSTVASKWAGWSPPLRHPHVQGRSFEPSPRHFGAEDTESDDSWWQIAS